MALFGRKKDGADQRPHDTGSPDGDEGAKGKGRKSEDSAVGVSISPDKARRFWEHARTADQTANYEYALQLWLRGLRFDPTDMTALESFVRSALEFNQSKNGKKGPSRETIREFSGRDGVNPYLSALLTWATKPRDTAAIVRAAKAGAKLKIDEPTFWLAERAQTILRAESKPRKSLCTQLMAVFAELDAFEKAVQCGEMAVRLDPTDGQLAASVKNLAAQAAMAGINAAVVGLLLAALYDPVWTGAIHAPQDFALALAAYAALAWAKLRYGVAWVCEGGCGYPVYRGFNLAANGGIQDLCLSYRRTS